MKDDPDEEGVGPPSIVTFMKKKTESTSGMISVPIDSKPLIFVKETPHGPVSSVRRVPVDFLIPVVAEKLNVTLKQVMEITVESPQLFPSVSLFKDEQIMAWVGGAEHRDLKAEAFFDRCKALAEIDTELDVDMRVSTRERLLAMMKVVKQKLMGMTKEQLVKGVLVVGSKNLFRRVKEITKQFSVSNNFDVPVSYQYSTAGTAAEPQSMLISELRSHPAFLKVLAYDFLDLVALDPSSGRNVTMLHVLNQAGRSALERILDRGIYITPIVMGSACAYAAAQKSMLSKHLRSNMVYGFSDGEFIHHALPLAVELEINDKLFSMPYGNPVTSMFRMLVWENTRDKVVVDVAMKSLLSQLKAPGRKSCVADICRPDIIGDKITCYPGEIQAPRAGIVTLVRTKADVRTAVNQPVLAINSDGTFELDIRTKIPFRLYAIYERGSYVPWFFHRYDNIEYSTADGLIESGYSKIIVDNCIRGEPRFQRMVVGELDSRWLSFDTFDVKEKYAQDTHCLKAGVRRKPAMAFQIKDIEEKRLKIESDPSFEEPVVVFPEKFVYPVGQKTKLSEYFKAIKKQKREAAVSVEAQDVAGMPEDEEMVETTPKGLTSPVMSDEESSWDMEEEDVDMKDPG